MSLCTYQQVINEIKANGDDPTRPASIYGMQNILENLKDVTARIEEYCQDYFAPFNEIRPYDATQQYIDPWRNQLMLDRSLLVVNSIVINNTTLTAWDGIFANRSTADYTLYPYGHSPASNLLGLQSGATWYPSTYGAVQSGAAGVMGAIAVDGIWGFRQHYPAQGWKLSGNTVLNSPSLSASGTSVTVTDASLFSVGDYLLIGTEYLEVEGINNTNVLTVERGVRGSVAAIHLAGSTISTWQAERNIIRAAVKFTSLLYKRAGIFNKVEINAAGTYATVFDTDMPDEVKNILRQYINIQSAKV